MIQATCIQKFYKNNKIYGYRLQDSQGAIKDVYADPLKQAIHNQQITVLNLTLTSDNRLVDTTPNKSKPVSQQSKILEEQQIQNLTLKSKALGMTKEIPTACGHHCTLISKSDTQHIIYIPDDVEMLNGENYNKLAFTKHIRDIQGNIKVIGGHNLQNTNSMFANCQAQSLDLSSFDTSNVTDMRGMFYECKAQSIDLSSFNTSNVTDMRYMFDDCKAQYLDLSSFNTSKVTDMYRMFVMCRAQILDLSSFDTRKVTDMSFMFSFCKAQSIDLSSFDISNTTVIGDMFNECNAQIKATDPKILEVYKKRNW